MSARRNHSAVRKRAHYRVSACPRRERRLLLVAAACIGACGGLVDDAASVGPVQLDTVAHTAAKTFCGSLGACCRAEGVPLVEGGCTSTLEQGYDGLVELARRGKVVFDADEAKNCIESVRDSLLEDCTIHKLDACDAAFVGTVDPGEPCTTAVECRSPTRGDLWCIGEAVKTCSIRPRGEHGDACARTCFNPPRLYPGLQPLPLPGTTEARVSCLFVGRDLSNPTGCYRDEGLYCSPETFACQRLLPLGASCTEGACEVGLWCDGTCRKPLPLGAPCPFITTSDPCEGALECLSGTCQRDPGGDSWFAVFTESVCGGQ